MEWKEELDWRQELFKGLLIASFFKGKLNQRTQGVKSRESFNLLLRDLISSDQTLCGDTVIIIRFF